MSAKWRYLTVGVTVLCLCIIFAPVALQSTNPKPGQLPVGGDNSVINKGLVAQQMGQMPLAFTKNEGQWDDQALFRANAGGATMWFTR